MSDEEDFEVMEEIVADPETIAFVFAARSQEEIVTMAGLENVDKSHAELLGLSIINVCEQTDTKPEKVLKDIIEFLDSNQNGPEAIKNE